MGFYKETWAKMDKFNALIEQFTNPTIRCGSVVLETATLKK